jgi:hypothetical protein
VHGLFTTSTCPSKGRAEILESGEIGSGLWKDSLQTKWILLTVLAPEAKLLFAVTILSISREIPPALKALADKQGVEWNLTHTIFVSIGGVVPAG